MHYNNFITERANRKDTRELKKILNGDVVIFPTDTVCGIGCDATNTNAIEEIYKLKSREKTKTLLLNLPSITEIKKIAHISNLESLLLENFNELTVIVKVKPNTHLAPYTIKNNEIGVRIPKNETLKTNLLKTGDAMLIEGNTWGDRIWGQVNGVGENNLGKILMRIREELKD